MSEPKTYPRKPDPAKEKEIAEIAEFVFPSNNQECML